MVMQAHEVGAKVVFMKDHAKIKIPKGSIGIVVRSIQHGAVFLNEVHWLFLFEEGRLKPSNINSKHLPRNLKAIP